jgi:hypothetical protein
MKGSDSDECLLLIKEKLEALGIEMTACPPMFYPEAIHNLFVWTAKASWECWGRHGFHGEWQPGPKVAQCIVKQIQERQKEGNPIP